MLPLLCDDVSSSSRLDDSWDDEEPSSVAIFCDSVIQRAAGAAKVVACQVENKSVDRHDSFFDNTTKNVKRGSHRPTMNYNGSFL